MEEGRSVIKILTSESIGKRPLGTSRRRLVDNIRMVSIREIGLIRLRIGIIAGPL
jgi:hypothetical protein